MGIPILRKEDLREIDSIKRAIDATPRNRDALKKKIVSALDQEANLHSEIMELTHEDRKRRTLSSQRQARKRC